MSLTAGAKSRDPRDPNAAVIDPSATSSSSSRDRSANAVRKISALGEMTGGIAHDLGNVLAAVASGLRIAEDHAGDPPRMTAALAAAHDGVERGRKMVLRLLAFARQQELRPAREDVSALLENLRAFLQYGAGPGIRVIVELAPQLPQCLVDPPQFNAAILNLVVNARDAMPAGGAITITTTAILRKTNGNHVRYVRVRVCDDGTGMPPEVTQRIFDPYFTTKGEAGTGLGIPQVQDFMRQAGGFVTVDSNVGKGTSFDLFFPVQNEEPSAADAARPSGPAGRMADQSLPSKRRRQHSRERSINVDYRR